MYFIYTVLVHIVGQLLKTVALFQPKMKLFIEGRKHTLALIQKKIQKEDRTIWVHAASLGEYEQGLPVIEGLRTQYPNHKIVLTFFSPSGYEVRKDNNVADVTVYLPLDTTDLVTSFLDAVHPEMAFFIKYEFWPNYLKELKNRNIPTFLISGIFRPNQVFFKWYGSFYRNAIKSMTYFFVQNEESKKLLNGIGLTNVKISGDTRFDRVATILERDNTVDFISNFKGDSTLVVIGSSWPEDEKLLSQYINTSTHHVKFVFAPHNIKPEQIAQLKNSISKNVCVYSEMTPEKLKQSEVFLLDTVGLLTKVYSYADIAYIGGGFEKGIHNILEPATFGIPIIIGPKYKQFAEAIALIDLGGCHSVNNYTELKNILDLVIQNEDERLEQGHISNTFVQMNKNVTGTILQYLKMYHPKN